MQTGDWTLVSRLEGEVYFHWDITAGNIRTKKYKITHLELNKHPAISKIRKTLLPDGSQISLKITRSLLHAGIFLAASGYGAIFYASFDRNENVLRLYEAY